MNTALAEAVRSAIDVDGRITSKTIEVSEMDGSVNIHGVVDSLEELGIIQEVAESVPGVARVTNHLQIDGEVNTGPCCPPM